MSVQRQEPPVVVAEDNFLTARLIAACLQQAGQSVVLARTGDDVLNLVQKYDPDLVLLNLNLIRPSGVELLRFLQPRRDRLKILAMTAPGQADLKSAATGLGVGAFFETPFFPQELASTVKFMLRKAS